MIEVKNLGFAYDEKVSILEAGSFSIGEREWVAIFGPNGGGKTTLLRLILGFLEPTCGTIQIVGSKPQLFWRKIGYVPQNNRYDKQFPISVFDLVLTGLLSQGTFWGGVTRESKDAARAALEVVGLSHLADRAFGTLSGGQAQRALIARAIVHRPKLLLLDESTANIDPEARDEIYALLGTLQDTMTILMVTHDLSPVINRVSTLLCVQKRITSYLPSQVCQHFTLGLYHP